MKLKHPGKVLKTHREAANLSGRDLSRLSGVSQAQISKIENGVHTPDRAIVDGITRALNLDEESRHHLDQCFMYYCNVSMSSHPQSQKVATAEAWAQWNELDASFEVPVSLKLFCSEFTGWMRCPRYAARIVLLRFEKETSSQSLDKQAQALNKAIAKWRGIFMSPTGPSSVALISESGLYKMTVPSDIMVEQLLFVREVICSDNNASFGILEETGDYPFSIKANSVHHFALSDDAVVKISLFHNLISYTDPEIVQCYLKHFETLKHAAVMDHNALELIDKAIAYHESNVAMSSIGRASNN